MSVVIKLLNRLYVVLFYSSAFLAGLSTTMMVLDRFNLLNRSPSMDEGLLALGIVTSAIISFLVGKAMSHYQRWAYRRRG